MSSVIEEIILPVAFVVVLSLVAFGAYSIYQSSADYEIGKEKCEKILTCERYVCLADNSNSINWKNNYLLQEQSCLLKEAKGK